MNRVCPGQGETWSPQCPALEIFYLCKLHLGYLLFSHPVMSNSLQPHGLQHTRPLCPSPSPEVCPSSCPLDWCCHPAISSSDALFSCSQSFPALGTFSMSHLFISDDQNTGDSALVLPVNTQGWFPLRLIGLWTSMNEWMPSHSVVSDSLWL